MMPNWEDWAVVGPVVVAEVALVQVELEPWAVLVYVRPFWESYAILELPICVKLTHPTVLILALVVGAEALHAVRAIVLL